jgi:hypothetical protein
MVLATEHLGNHHVLKGMELNKHNRIKTHCYCFPLLYLQADTGEGKSNT